MADIDTTSVPVAGPSPPHMQKATILLGNLAARSTVTGFASAALLLWPTDPQIWREIWQMQEAVWQRQSRLQTKWMQAWSDWATEFTRARGANTLTKLVEQEFDLIGQWQELVSSQATNVVNLLENLEINYAYWVNEKLRPAETTTVGLASPVV